MLLQLLVPCIARRRRGRVTPDVLRRGGDGHRIPDPPQFTQFRWRRNPAKNPRFSAVWPATR
jgi:hypothetical protein